MLSKLDQLSFNFLALVFLWRVVAQYLTRLLKEELWMILSQRVELMYANLHPKKNIIKKSLTVLVFILRILLSFELIILL